MAKTNLTSISADMLLEGGKHYAKNKVASFGQKEDVRLRWRSESS